MTGDLTEAESSNIARIKFVRERLEYHIDRYRTKRNVNRLMTSMSKISAILIGASVTILLSLKSSDLFKQYDLGISAIALILSSAVTVITACEAFADFSWKWIRYRTTLMTLYDIRDDFSYQLSESKELPVEKTNEFYDRIKLAIKETNEEWAGKRAPSIAGVVSEGTKK